jgi:hypothetical protein
MTRRVVNVESRAYLFSPDVQPTPAERTWAVVRARVIDEMTAEPPLTQITVETDRTELTPRTAAGGIVGLVGTPLRVFPSLDLQGYPVGLTVGGRGYVTLRETVNVAQNVNFPGQFAPTDHGTLALHRDPVRITGRTVLAGGGTTTPVAGATVSITGVWPTLPAANVVVLPDPPNLVSLLPPTFFAHTAPAAVLHRRELTPVVGEEKLLLTHAPAGSLTLAVSDRVNLTGGNVVALDESDPERTEYLFVQSVAGASTDTEPATVTLAYATARAHYEGAVLRRVTPQVAAADNQLTRDCIAGDTCLFLDGMLGLAGASVVEITGGGGSAEYHLVRQFKATSDADGYYRLPPLARVAQAELLAHDGAHPDINVTVTPDYAVGVHRIDFVFR